MPASIATLTRLIDNEVIRAMGVPLDSWLAERLHYMEDIDDTEQTSQVITRSAHQLMQSHLAWQP